MATVTSRKRNKYLIVAFLGPDPTDPNCPSNSSATTERREDFGVRFGQETGRSTGSTHPNTGTYPTQQT